MQKRRQGLVSRNGIEMKAAQNYLALRLDDVGASSKKYEVYSNKYWNIGKIQISGNWLILKYLPSIKAWGPYREMKANEWYILLGDLEKYNAKLTVAITAMWAESESSLIPFPKRFPDEAIAIKEGLGQGLLEIANHGLTHCVVERNAFRPKWFSGNRKFHREFGPHVSLDIQERHIQESQKILEDWFETTVVTFVPPGNQFIDSTLDLIAKHGLRVVSCNTTSRVISELTVVGNQDVFPFHDRDVVLGGMQWFRNVLEENKDKHFCFIRDFAYTSIENSKS